MADYTVSTDFRGDARSLVNAMSASRSAAGKLSARLDTLHGGMRRVNDFGKRVATGAIALGVAGGLAAGTIVGAGAEFESAIAAVGAVGLQTRDQIEDLEDKARELGGTTQFTATQSAKAMLTLRKAGFDTAATLDATGPIMSAAAADQIGIAEASKHVSSALKGLQLEAGEAGRVANVLALASSKTQSSIGSLGESLSKVSSTARQLGVPLESTVAGVALLQDVGLDASVAGSALNTMLTKLAKPTDEIKNKMDEFGVTFQDAAGNMLPLEGVLQNMSKAAQQSGGNLSQVAFFADLVGLRGQKAATNLKDLFESGRVQELTTALSGAEGVARKMAELRMDTLKGDVTKLRSAIDEVFISSSEGGEGLRNVVQATTAWVSANKDVIASGLADFLRFLITSLPDAITWLKRITVGVLAFKALTVAVGAASVATKAYAAVAASSSAKAIGATVAQKGVWMALATTIDAANAATKRFMIAAAVNPMTWIVGAVAAIALMVVYWDEVADATAKAIRKVQAYFGVMNAEKVDKAIESGKLLESDQAGFEAAKRKRQAERRLQGDEGLMASFEEMIKKSTSGESVSFDGAPSTESGGKKKAEKEALRELGIGVQPDFLAPSRPQLSLSERLERRETKSEIVIRDETGRAEVKSAPSEDSGTKLSVERSGAP